MRMSECPSMEKQYSVQFFTAFVSNLQKLCQAYVKFDRNVEVSGYLCVEVDNSKKERYVLSELIQNCGSVVSESYCTKVFRTFPVHPSSTHSSTKQDNPESWSVNPSIFSSERPRPKPQLDRRGSISSNKSSDSFNDGRDYDAVSTESDLHRQSFRSKRLSFDHDKENAARLSRDIIQRLTGETVRHTPSDMTRHATETTTRPVQRRESLPSFAHITGSRVRSSSMDVPDIENIKVEGSRHASCAQAKPQSVPSSPVGDGYGGAVPIGIHANLSTLSHLVDSFAASKTPQGQSSHSALDKFSRPGASALMSSPQSTPTSSSLAQSWSSQGRPQTSRSQHEVFMQMLPQGYEHSETKSSVHVLDRDNHPKTTTAEDLCAGEPDSVVDLDIDEMDTDNGDNSIHDVTPSLNMSGIDQSVISEYMMSSSQASDVQRKRNAQLNCQRYALRLFCEFHQSQSGAMPSLDSLTSEQMDAMLGQFYTTSKKGNGEDFTVSSLRSIQYYLESHLFENYIHTGSRAIIFKNSRLALRKRCEELRLKIKNTPVSKKILTSSDIDILFEKGQLGAGSPDILLNTLWFMNSTCFGIKGSEHFSLRWGDIILNTDKEGRQYLEYCGSGSSNQSSHPHRVYALPHNQSRCCVYYFKQYLSHRPSIALQPDDPFYLSINNQFMLVGSWYIKEKVSVSRLASVWRNILFAAGLPQDKKTPVGFQVGLLVQHIQDSPAVSPPHPVDMVDIKPVLNHLDISP